MWRNSTVEARISILDEKQAEIENELIQSLTDEKEKKFVTDAAEYVVMTALRYCKNGSYHFNLEHQGEITCGLLETFNIKQFSRLKGVLLGLGRLYKIVGIKCKSKGISIPKSQTFAKVMKKVWKTIHDNDGIMAGISFDESTKILGVLTEIAVGLANTKTFELDDINKFLFLCNEDDQLSIFIGFMSLPDMSFYIRKDEEKRNIYLLSNFTFYINDTESIKDKYSKQLKDVCTVFQLYKVEKNGLTFQPNEKYFFESNKEHRVTCFMTIAVLNKLAHRALNEISKVETNGGK